MLGKRGDSRVFCARTAQMHAWIHSLTEVNQLTLRERCDFFASRLLPFIFDIQRAASATVAAFRVIWKKRVSHLAQRRSKLSRLHDAMMPKQSAQAVRVLGRMNRTHALLTNCLGVLVPGAELWIRANFSGRSCSSPSSQPVLRSSLSHSCLTSIAKLQQVGELEGRITLGS